MTKEPDTTVAGTIARLGTDAIDPEDVAAAAAGLTALALTEIERGLRYGSPAFRQSILRSFIPAIVKATTSRDERDEQIEDMKKEMALMRAQFIDSYGGNDGDGPDGASGEGADPEGLPEG